MTEPCRTDESVRSSTRTPKKSTPSSKADFELGPVATGLAGRHRLPCLFACFPALHVGLGMYSIASTPFITSKQLQLASFFSSAL